MELFLHEDINKEDIFGRITFDKNIMSFRAHICEMKLLLLIAVFFPLGVFAQSAFAQITVDEEKNYQDLEWKPAAYPPDVILGYVVVPLKKKREILSTVISENGLPDSVIQRPGALEDYAAQMFDAILTAEGYVTDDYLPKWFPGWDGLKSLQDTLDKEIQAKGRLIRPGILKEKEEDIIPFCIDVFENEKEPERSWSCAGVLDRMRSRAKSAVPQLLAVFKKPNWISGNESGSSVSLYQASFEALNKIDPQTVTSDLRDILGHNLTTGGSELKKSAAEYLVQIDSFSSNLTGEILKELLAVDFQKAYDALPALTKTGPEGKKAVRKTLLRSLSDDSREVRKNAAIILRHVGKFPDAEPYLLKSLKDDDKEVREQSAFALSKIGPSRKSIPSLGEALKENNWFLRAHVLDALGEIGPEAKRVADIIPPFLFDDTKSVRYSAAQALGKIGASDKLIVNEMIKAVGVEKDNWVKSAIVSSLKKIGTPEALEAVEKAGQQKN